MGIGGAREYSYVPGVCLLRCIDLVKDAVIREVLLLHLVPSTKAIDRKQFESRELCFELFGDRFVSRPIEILRDNFLRVR